MTDNASLFELSFANRHRRNSLLICITVTVVVLSPLNIRIYSNPHSVYICNFSMCFDCSVLDLNAV